MFGNSPVIKHPFGISVFGSTLLRVPPDSVTIRAAIARLEEKPSDAFAKARKAEQSVTAFLRKAPVKESGLSKISLSQEYRFSNNERRSVGYVARIGLTVVISELDQIEKVLSGLVDAGANEITATEFHTIRLKELRARARPRTCGQCRPRKSRDLCGCSQSDRWTSSPHSGRGPGYASAGISPGGRSRSDTAGIGRHRT